MAGYCSRAIDSAMRPGPASVCMSAHKWVSHVFRKYLRVFLRYERTSHSPRWMGSDEAVTISHMTTPKRTRPSTCDCQCCGQLRLVPGGLRTVAWERWPRCSRPRVLSASWSRSGGRRRPSRPLILVETSLSPTQTFHVEKCVCEMQYDLGFISVLCVVFCMMVFEKEEDCPGKPSQEWRHTSDPDSVFFDIETVFFWFEKLKMKSTLGARYFSL